LYILHTDGRLTRFNGSYYLWINNVQSFALVPDGSGDVYALYSQNGQNSLYLFHRAGGCNNLHDGVQSFAVDAKGDLDALFVGGALEKWNGSSWDLWINNVQSFALVPDGSGDVYALYSQNGQNSLYLFHRAGGCNNLHDGVQSFVVGRTGSTVDVLDVSGNLWQYTGSTPNLLAQGIQSIWLDNSGYTLFALDQYGNTLQFPA
jgi:hypothetical protein